MKRTLFSLFLWFVPVLVLAAVYDTGVLRYSDVAEGSPGAVAISTLTGMGVLEGNPDGSFRPYSSLNRAEFTKIVMGLLEDDGTPYSTSCFADVPSTAWYAGPVCRAKALGIVSGNALAGVPAEEWPFAASRDVNFAEAVKILVEMYGFDVRLQRQNEQWFVRYFEAVLPVLGGDAHFALQDADLSSAAVAGRTLKRWEMARLAVLFVAHEAGELAEYRLAEDGEQVSSSSVSSSSQPRSFSSLSVSSVISKESSSVASSVQYDPDSDVSQYTNFLQLGDRATQVLAAVNVFSDTEPLVLNTITITLDTSVSSIEGLSLYDSFGRYLGRAFRESSTTYVLNVMNSNIIVPKREDYSFYIRAQLKSFTSGGVSGEMFRVSSVTVEGDGEWSSRSYTKGSSDTFPQFQTARSVITSIDSPGPGDEPLAGGEDALIGTYRFKGDQGDGAADLEVTAIVFQLTLVGGVTVANPALSSQGLGIRHSCSTTSTTVITCSSIPDYIGSFEDGPIILELYGDVTVPEDALKAALGANINQPGSPGSAGAVTWSDGSASFTWVPFGSPVVRGTYFEQ